MASVINTNTLSMVTQQNLNQSQNALNTSMERLSSGLRINSAKDDAAGQAIANRMDSQITGLSQAQRNANDGISVAQTAEGALNQVNDNLQRVRELTVQAQNDTNNADDLSSIQDEITMRLDEIDRISEQTSFNGINVLSENNSLTIQVGANDNESITIDLQEMNKTALGLASFDVTKSMSAKPELGEQVGYNDTYGEIYEVKDENGQVLTNTFGAKADDGSIVAMKVADGTNIEKNEANGGYVAVEYKNSDGADQVATLQFAAKDASSNDYSNGTLEIVGTQGDEIVSVGDITTASFDGTEIDISATAAGAGMDMAVGGLAQLDSALKAVDSQRSALGAVQNRFDSAITNLATTETNLASAQSRIQDADYAEEVSSMTTAQILQQAGTSMLTQANQVPQNVLSLLG